MQFFPTPDGGMDGSKIVQKSFGVMSGVFVPPKAWLGAEAAMGTIRVGMRCEYSRVPLGGQERPLTSLSLAFLRYSCVFCIPPLFAMTIVSSPVLLRLDVAWVRYLSIYDILNDMAFLLGEGFLIANDSDSNDQQESEESVLLL